MRAAGAAPNFSRMAIRTIGFSDLARSDHRVDTGAKLVLVAGAAVLVYGLVFLVMNFTSFIEIGLSPALVGGDAGSLQAADGAMYRYISHLQVNLAAFIVANGLMMILVSWFGIRRGERWAVVAVLATYLLGLLIGLPIHYVYGLATLVHVGPFYLVTALVVAGCALAWSGLGPSRAGSPPG